MTKKSLQHYYIYSKTQTTLPLKHCQGQTSDILLFIRQHTCELQQRILLLSLFYCLCHQILIFGWENLILTGKPMKSGLLSMMRFKFTFVLIGWGNLWFPFFFFDNWTQLKSVSMEKHDCMVWIPLTHFLTHQLKNANQSGFTLVWMCHWLNCVSWILLNSLQCIWQWLSKNSIKNQSVD